MRWWHQDGALSSWGMALQGLRVGAWRGRHPGGAPAFEGAFAGGQREGLWTFWHPDGSLAERGEYQGGARAGTWESFAVGERPAAAPIWPDDGEAPSAQ
jgi:antitoxin component YwqK of YwqJK toxin-antitoxin module